MTYVQNALGFTIETLVGLYLIAVILRFLIQLLKIDVRNMISQTVFSVTNRPLSFFRSFTPGLYGIDLASVLLVITVAFLKYGLLVLVSEYPFSISGVLLISIGESINIITWILLIAIIIQAILSWVAPTFYHPAIIFLSGLSEPVLSKFRRLLPNMQGLDLSPILAILAINLAQSLIARPLIDAGSALLRS